MELSLAAEQALCRARLYRPARNTYHRLANRAYYAERVGARRFLQQFVTRGTTVFDVGANRGVMAELFLELGAGRVVAVEPHPGLAATIRRRYPSVHVVEAAIGREPGTGTLHVGRDNLHSTLSDEWAESLSDRFSGTLTVPVVTLAELICEHGVPGFVKVDVEGYEDAALSTIREPVAALSFEYQTSSLEITERCIAQLAGLGDYEFGASLGEELRLDTDWTSADALLEYLTGRRVAQTEAHGDVYARLKV
jgi:FkbM family methyltransferase